MTTLTSDNASRVEATQHGIDGEGVYRIRDFDSGPAFAGFLPGIAGRAGVPLWCMYVNRGQGVVSFGTEGKDAAILEFLPATWAYQLVGVQGFRTFIKVDGEYFEPFQNDESTMQREYRRTLGIEVDRLTVEEENTTFGLSIEASYFSVVESNVPALVRRLRIRNTQSVRRSLSLLDGLPLIQPAGFTDFQMKKMRRLSEAYACVQPIAGAAFYSARVRVHDEAEVEEFTDGHFYAAKVSRDGRSLVEALPLVDPDVVFGQGRDFVTPRQFLLKDHIDRDAQIWENRLGCALVPVEAELGADECVEVISLVGRAPSPAHAERFIARFRSTKDVDVEREASRALMASLTQPAFTASANPFFDAYCTQNYVDNILRGGVPFAVPSREGPRLLHLYSRRHGDLERDYNEFRLAAHPLSDGPGNYRDILQNRRSDVWFYPDVLDREIRMFASLLQADGYNPLSIEGFRHTVPPETDALAWCPSQDPHARAAFARLFSRAFAPGEVLGWADQFCDVAPIPDTQAWLEGILQACDCQLVASGHEGGYWIDHWSYLIDLLEAFQAVFPDGTTALLTGASDIAWYPAGASVAPRAQKHFLRPSGPLQIEAVRTRDASATASPLPPTTLLGKLTSLVALKALSLDDAGIGVEMEAGRPGWNDALNGLPGLFGSSTCEAVETLRLAEWLLAAFDEFPAIELPEIVAGFVRAACADLERPDYDWDRATSLRESFRAELETSASTRTESVDGPLIARVLRAAVARLRRGMVRAIDPRSGLIHTYYTGQPVQFHTLDASNGTAAGDVDGWRPHESPRLHIESFERSPLPLYLEGQVHLLRVTRESSAARRIHRSVRGGPLFDDQLSMYKLNESLAACSPKIGRARTFSRGWFENESIWLHMSYKYLLELLRCGLLPEFFADAETMLVPFMDPAVYGRSILENSSFIASSACPDPQARGRGFVARLSGTTAEFIQIWLYLTVGERPFRIVEGRLALHLQPSLPGDWFTLESQAREFDGEAVEIPANAFACAFLGQSLLVYHNPLRRDTFGPGGVRPARLALDGGQPKSPIALAESEVHAIRNRSVRRIDVWLE